MIEPELIRGDRRRDRRYDFTMELRFSYQQWGFTAAGTGRTLDLSRTSVRFEADEPIPDGVTIELQIDWPFLLRGIEPLTLNVTGVVLHTDGRGTVLRMRRHQFVTGKGRTCTALDGPIGFGLIA